MNKNLNPDSLTTIDKETVLTVFSALPMNIKFHSGKFTDSGVNGLETIQITLTIPPEAVSQEVLIGISTRNGCDANYVTLGGF